MTTATTDANVDAAIARRNRTWAEYKAATQLLRAAERLDIDIAPYVANRNETLAAFEEAVRELVRARAAASLARDERLYPGERRR